MKILILNGPNLNLLGVREPGIYGDSSFEAYMPKLQTQFPDVEMEYYQSNVEGELINKLHEVGFSADGILLNEARVDNDLESYQLIMVDEAHERSLNIDITLGLLYQICQRRPDLRIIISSATLNPAQFQKFFAPLTYEVPLLSIDSKPFPIKYEYHPCEDMEYQEMLDTVEEEALRLHAKHEPGHILVFLSGMDAIRRITHMLEEDYPHNAALCAAQPRRAGGGL